MITKKYIAAAVQASPVYMNLDATVEKACNLIKEAADNGAKLIGFPEAFLPGYPWWIWQKSAEEGFDNYKLLLENSVVPGESAFIRLARCAKDNSIFVCISGHERVGDSLYMTQFWFDDEGNNIGKHRKMKATAAERRVWTDGDGSTMNVMDTKIGKVGSLQCGEHQVPAYHAVLGAQGEQVHVAGWPPLTVEGPVGSMALMGNLAAVQSLCIENKAFAIFSTQIIDQYSIDFLCHGDEKLIQKLPTSGAGLGGLGGGAAAIINPLGEIISGELLDQCTDGIVYGVIDLDEAIPGKMLYDIYGNSMKGGCMHIVLNRNKEEAIKFVGEKADNYIAFSEIASK